MFEMSQVRSGRAGSGQELFNYHGSGRIALFLPDPQEANRPAKSPEQFLHAKDKMQTGSRPCSSQRFGGYIYLGSERGTRGTMDYLGSEPPPALAQHVAIRLQQWCWRNYV